MKEPFLMNFWRKHTKNKKHKLARAREKKMKKTLYGIAAATLIYVAPFLGGGFDAGGCIKRPGTPNEIRQETVYRLGGDIKSPLDEIVDEESKLACPTILPPWLQPLIPTPIIPPPEPKKGISNKYGGNLGDNLSFEYPMPRVPRNPVDFDFPCPNAPNFEEFGKSCKEYGHSPKKHWVEQDAQEYACSCGSGSHAHEV
jgi:hypothetical protein